jgi:hypothetical protein
LEDIQKAQGRLRFPLFTFVTQVCTFILSFIWTAFQVENTEDIKYPEPERNAVNLNQTTTPIADRFASRQITHERNPGPNDRPLELTGVNSKLRRVPEVDGGEGSTEYHASPRTPPSKEALKKMSANVPGHKRTEPIPVASTLAPPRTSRAAPHSSSEGKVTRLELEQQLSVSLAAQTERDHRIAQLTDELALKSALLEQAEANAVEAARRAEPELREHADDRRPMRTSLVKQRDVELVDMQARLGDMQVKLDELLLSRDQQIGQYEKEFANVRTKLEAKESELDAVRLRLTDAEKGLAKRKAEADTLHARIAAGSVNGDEDQVTRRFMERARALEAEMVSKRWNEKSIEEMECRNEGGGYFNWTMTIRYLIISLKGWPIFNGINSFSCILGFFGRQHKVPKHESRKEC